FALARGSLIWWVEDFDLQVYGRGDKGFAGDGGAACDNLPALWTKARPLRNGIGLGCGHVPFMALGTTIPEVHETDLKVIPWLSRRHRPRHRSAAGAAAGLGEK